MLLRAPILFSELRTPQNSDVSMFTSILNAASATCFMCVIIYSLLNLFLNKYLTQVFLCSKWKCTWKQVDGNKLNGSWMSSWSHPCLSGPFLDIGELRDHLRLNQHALKTHLIHTFHSLIIRQDSTLMLRQGSNTVVHLLTLLYKNRVQPAYLCSIQMWSYDPHWDEGEDD